jgi:aldehyde:ferredoxin oxidoreductase
MVAGQDPLDKSNPLVFMTGPLTGTIVPWSGRHCVAAISPLTGLWGEAYSGGTFARELKRAGFDGIVITGKAERLVYLKVTDTEISIEDGTELTGVDTYEIEAILRKRCGEKTKVAAIGNAGEQLVKFACVMNDGPAGRAAARCGLGAVMGSKNLKAIAIAGSGEVQLANRERLVQAINSVMPKLNNDPEHRLQKAQSIYALFIDNGRNSVRNWRDGELEGYKDAVLKETEKHIYEGKSYHCAGCRTSCVESHIGTKGRLLHWEAFAPLGSQCGLTDMSHVQRAFDICNRHGVDSISAGGVISFAMECFEEGLITLKDTDDIDLRFGNSEAMIAMLEKICKREGFGAVLAEGVKGAARPITSWRLPMQLPTGVPATAKLQNRVWEMKRLKIRGSFSLQ